MALGRSKSIELFKVAGVQVEIDYSWLVIFALVLWCLSAGYFPQVYPGHPTLDYWIVGLVATLLFFASVLIHELSHAAVGNRLGENIDRITLFIFGGMAHLSGEPKNADDEIKIAGVGPLSSVVLALVFWLIATAMAQTSPTSLWTATFRYLAFINLALALFNLLPGFPLDGGRLLRAILWKRWGDLQRATARAADWGSGIAWGLMGLGGLEIFAGALVGGLWLIFIGLFLRAAAASGYQGTMIEQTLHRIRVGDIMTRQPVTLAPEMPVAQVVEQYFLRLGYGGFPVVSDGARVVGMLSLSHVRQCPPEERGQKTVADVMRPLDAAIEIAADASAIEAMHKMNEANSGRLVVTDQGRLVGLITRTGVARFVQIKTQLGAETPPAGESA
jgi:Zn-dependent protease/predicted transcriptional regulator